MKIRLTVTLLLLAGFAASVAAYSFRQKAYIPRGMMWTDGLLRGYDTNHDGLSEVIFCVGRPDTFYKKTHLWQYGPVNRYILTAVIGDSGFYSSDVGNLDNDSLTDIVGFNCDNRIPWEIPLAIYESPDYRSHPTQVSWQWVIPLRATPSDCHISDLDGDGRKEIMFTSAGRIMYLLENCGNNRFSLVWCDTAYSHSAWAHSFGDFDCDGRNEFATSGLIPYRENVQVFECVGDDQYLRTWCDTLFTGNANDDNISANDLDQDGKPEFVIGSCWAPQPGPWIGCLWIYEATGDNMYDVSFRDTVPDIRTFPDWNATSSTGDVDADGVDELVWAVANNWLIYKASGNNQFNRIYTGYPWPQGNLHNATNILVYDLNKNGYCEIVESGGNETHIFEIEGARVLKPDSGQVWPGGSQQWIRWRKFDPPGADSFSLFVSYNNGQTFETIATGLGTNDTAYLWSVPNINCDSCKIMIWSYGPPRAGQSTPRGIAWDFSGRFALRQTAVGEEAMGNRQWAGLKILQNPTTTERGVRLLVMGNGQGAKLQIYDVAGKLVRSYALGPMPSALCSVALRPGVYFIRLEAAGATHTAKAVVME